VADEARAAIVTAQAGRINSLAGFQATARDIQALPLSLQAEPLLALGLRIHALPQRERQQAIAAFRSMVATLSDAYCTPELVDLDRVAAHETATSAVEAGEKVQVVANFHGITDPSLIYGLEMVTIDTNAPNSAGEAVAAGANIQFVAQRHGITTSAGLQNLNRISTIPRARSPSRP